VDRVGEDLGEDYYWWIIGLEFFLGYWGGVGFLCWGFWVYKGNFGALFFLWCWTSKVQIGYVIYVKIYLTIPNKYIKINNHKNIKSPQPNPTPTPITITTYKNPSNTTPIKTHTKNKLIKTY
jgi:hypothetical protein